MTTAERLAALEARMASNTTLLAEVHAAVIGDGSKQSSLRERLSAVEAQNDWRHRTVYSVFPSILVAVLAHLGIHVPSLQS